MKLYGCDLYHGDGKVDWGTVYENSQFAIIKATQGTTIVDSAFKRNIKTAKDAGLFSGAYHYFKPTGDSAAQANFFLKTVGSFKGLLVPFLDVEEAGEMSSKEIVASVGAFIKQVEDTIGRGCVFYTYPSFITEHLVGQEEVFDLSGYPLWIASYPKSGKPTGKPSIPGIWDSWTFWQYTDHGNMPGVPGTNSVDLDVFNGGKAEMEKLVVK